MSTGNGTGSLVQKFSPRQRHLSSATSTTRPRDLQNPHESPAASTSPSGTPTRASGIRLAIPEPYSQTAHPSVAVFGPAATSRSARQPHPEMPIGPRQARTTRLETPRTSSRRVPKHSPPELPHSTEGASDRPGQIRRDVQHPAGILRRSPRGPMTRCRHRGPPARNSRRRPVRYGHP